MLAVGQPLIICYRTVFRMLVRSQNMRLKNRVNVTMVWLATCVDEVSEVVRAPDRSVVIGWPMTNVVMTFDSVDIKRHFENELKRSVADKLPRVVLNCHESLLYVHTKCINLPSVVALHGCVCACMEVLF